MRYPQFALALAVFIVGCESKTATSEPENKPPAPLVDLTSRSTLSAARTAFNAHKGEVRFLTLLSPT